MAVTITPYDHAALQLLNLGLGSGSDVFYLALSDGTTTLDTSHTALTQTMGGGADEVFGNGWPQDGVSLSNFATTQVNTTDAKIDADDITVAASGGAIAANAGVIYVDIGNAGTTRYPMWYVDFGEQITAPDGVDFQVVWHADGIATVSLAT